MGKKFEKMHLCITKIGLLESIYAHTAARVFSDFNGTDHDACEWVNAQPFDTIVMGECRNQKEGHCMGHKYEECDGCEGTGKISCPACGGEGKHEIWHQEDHTEEEQAALRKIEAEGEDSTT